MSAFRATAFPVNGSVSRYKLYEEVFAISQVVKERINFTGMLTVDRERFADQQGRESLLRLLVSEHAF